MGKEKKEYIDVSLVKSLMKSRGIDEKAMAGLVGVAPQTIKRFLSGSDQSHLSAEWLIKISKALNVPIPYIIHENYHKLHPEK